jgi:hypothetical protein
MNIADRDSISQISDLPEKLRQYIELPHGVGLLVGELPSLVHLESPPLTIEHKMWEVVGSWYRQKQRFQDALAIYSTLYDQLLAAQEAAGTWYIKGTPLVWMSDCYAAMGCTAISQRYLMLTLIEDAISGRGEVSPTETETGVYFRMVWRGWLSDAELKRYASKIYELYKTSPEAALYPEWVLQQLDRDWITQAPTPQEAGIFAPNLRYIKHMIGGLDDPSGKPFEALADYLMSCMPGCRTMKRKQSPSTDYDLICSIERSNSISARSLAVISCASARIGQFRPTLLLWQNSAGCWIRSSPTSGYCSQERVSAEREHIATPRSNSLRFFRIEGPSSWCLPAGLRHLSGRTQVGRGRGHRDPQGRHRDGRALAAPPPPSFLARPGPVRPNALPARRGIARPLRLFTLRHRPARLHWRPIRANGGNSSTGTAGAGIRDPPRRQPFGDSRSGDHCPPRPPTAVPPPATLRILSSSCTGHHEVHFGAVAYKQRRNCSH